MATTRIFSRRSRGLSCEIASDLCPNPLSHDWHVQPSCQRPNRDPPERCEFSPGELAQGESDCPRNFTTIRAAQNPVNACIPQNFHAFSTLGKAVGKRHRGAEPQGLKPEFLGRLLAVRL